MRGAQRSAQVRREAMRFRINARSAIFVLGLPSFCSTATLGHVVRETRPLAQEFTYLMQFDMRLSAPCDEAGNRIERDLQEAV
jgi:hypothetical protein